MSDYENEAAVRNSLAELSEASDDLANALDEAELSTIASAQRAHLDALAEVVKATNERIKNVIDALKHDRVHTL
jgi:ABC-type transporter Mla subunit MlaD